MTEINEYPWCRHGINRSGYCADCKVDSLITTIESQKEEIEKLLSERTENEGIIKRKLKIKQDCVDESMTKIESLKAITELKNAEIELLKDACESLFQLTQRGELTSTDLKEADDVYTDTLSEIERLTAAKVETDDQSIIRKNIEWMISQEGEN